MDDDQNIPILVGISVREGLEFWPDCDGFSRTCQGSLLILAKACVQAEC